MEFHRERDQGYSGSGFWIRDFESEILKIPRDFERGRKGVILYTRDLWYPGFLTHLSICIKYDLDKPILLSFSLSHA